MQCVNNTDNKNNKDFDLISIVVPTYKEVENIRLLIKEIHRVMKGVRWSYEVIIVDDDSRDGIDKVAAELKDEGLRAEVDARSERINLKIRQAQLDKVPYMLVVGDKEIDSSTISVRLRNGEQLAAQSLDSFKKTIARVIKDRVNEL